MGNLFSKKSLDDEVKEALQSNNEALVAKKIQEYLEKEKNIPLNIAVTGETGSGKSSFVNVIRGLDDDDEGAAPTGVVETTMEASSYEHPNFPNVLLWDLPGIGTMNYPAEEYLKMVGFEKFDFFIIISADRFRENDVKLAKEIQRMKKKFYFVRSKIDQDVRNEEKKKDFDKERILDQIRKNCTQELQKQGLESPQVFLVSSHKPAVPVSSPGPALLVSSPGPAVPVSSPEPVVQVSSPESLYDFPELLRTLERELPEHKRDAFLLAMPNTSPEMIDRKKKAFQSKIKYFATLSAAVAAAPVPGLSVAVDSVLLVGVVTWFVFGFNLDIRSLKRASTYSGVPYEELKKLIISPLAATKITPDVLLRIISQLALLPALMAAEEGTRFIPILGIPISMALSFTFTYKALNLFLEELADDAKKILQRVLVRTEESVMLIS